MIPEKTDSLPLSVLGNVWHPKPQNAQLANELYQHHQYLLPICEMLASRGVSLEAAPYFLEPKLKDFLRDPFVLKDMSQAVSRVVSAIKFKERITIFGDYDVDGATSTALLIRFFRMLGVEVNFYIPDRVEDGYGPSVATFEKVIASGCDLIITVDCGTLAFEPIEYANAKGVDVIVIDHHAAHENLPKAVAVVNPNRTDESDDFFKNLAAVGVSFLTCYAVVKRLKEEGFFQQVVEPNLMELLDLVALGTVCDVVGLTNLNRAFVRQGLRVMSQSQNTGIQCLARVLNISLSEVSAYHLGFVVGPRINAGGRIGESTLGATLLSCENEVEATEIANRLNVLNEERRSLQDITLQQAEQQVVEDKPVVLVSSDEWHQGVIGIVAGRLKDTYHKPTFVFSVDPQTRVCKGSARSISGFDVGACIHKCEDAGLILQGGGHAMAGGLSVDERKLPELEQFIGELFLQETSEADRAKRIVYDAEAPLESVTFDLIDQLEQLAPFGSGNPTPKFLISNVYLKKVLVLKEAHVRCFFESPLSKKRIDGMAFNAFTTNLGAFLNKMQGKSLSVLCTIKQDVWNGQRNIKLFIEDVRPA